MKHAVPQRRDPFLLLERALEEGWHSVEDIPLKGSGDFFVLTLSGLTRLARSRQTTRRVRPTDGWGPARAVVVAAKSGNYITAIAWRWREDG